MDRLGGTSSSAVYSTPSVELTLDAIDEILQLILNELSHPAAFAIVSKRHYDFAKDPYIRAMYFLARHGRIQALYWALGRGKLLNERVLDVSVPCMPPLLSRFFWQALPPLPLCHASMSLWSDLSTRSYLRLAAGAAMSAAGSAPSPLRLRSVAGKATDVGDMSWAMRCLPLPRQLLGCQEGMLKV